jgi:transposase
MQTHDPQKDHTQILPELPHEALYVGIDVGKKRHVAGFLSRTLLQRHQRFEGCPALPFEQSREGFHLLVDRMRSYAPLEACYVLLEHTGHYHKLVEQYLQEMDIAVYVVHVQKRQIGMLKTDKRDALNLANTLYSQLELGVQVAEKLSLVRRALPPTKAAIQLKGLIRHRYELIQESTQRRNKLTALCDEIFPELTQVMKDPNSPTALTIREKFPSPYALATASLAALQDVRGTNRSLSDGKLVQLQCLAGQSIGIKDVNRQRGLVLEQSLLIKELRLIQHHLEQLEEEICQIVEQSREGRILMSIPGIGPLSAATLIATIGNVANFSRAGELKSYLGWAPTREQTGTSFDRSGLTSGGARSTRQIMYLIVWHAIKQKDCEFAHLYERLVPLKCPYNDATRRFTGKGKVIGRIAGQMVSMIYGLLMTDYEITSHLAPGTKPPDPLLYDPEVHKRHRNGEYRALKPRKQKQLLIEQPNT